LTASLEMPGPKWGASCSSPALREAAKKVKKPASPVEAGYT
jgi:hypothetical protein